MQHGFIQVFLAHLLSLWICGTNNKTRILVNTFSHLRVNKKHFVYISHCLDICTNYVWGCCESLHTQTLHTCTVTHVWYIFCRSDCVYAFCRSDMLKEYLVILVIGHAWTRAKMYYKCSYFGPLPNKYCVPHVMSVFTFVMQKDHQTYILSICVLSVFQCKWRNDHPIHA